MTASDFTAWLELQGWGVAKAARELQLSRNTVDKYKRDGGPNWLGYACAAISFGLPMWKAA